MKKYSSWKFCKAKEKRQLKEWEWNLPREKLWRVGTKKNYSKNYLRLQKLAIRKWESILAKIKKLNADEIEKNNLI